MWGEKDVSEVELKTLVSNQKAQHSEQDEQTVEVECSPHERKDVDEALTD